MTQQQSKGKIIVTGGAGYIGSHTVVALCEAGFTPVIIDNLSNSSKSVLTALEEITGSPISFHEVDCTDTAAVSEIVKKEGPCLGIIHFAAYKSVGESVKQPLKYFENNFNSLISLLQVAKEHSISKIIFSSSCTVYGEPDALPVTEQTPMKKAESPYGYTKQVCEEIIAAWIKAEPTFKAVNLRYFNPIGAHPSGKIGESPNGVPENLLPYLTQVAVGQRDHLTIFGNTYNTSDGTCVRDYIHVMDLADAHVSALNWLISQPAPTNEVFNVGIGNGTTVLELINTFEEVTGVKLKYEIGEKRAGDIEKVYADPTKMKSMTGWNPHRTIADALRDSWRWQQNSKK